MGADLQIADSGAFSGVARRLGREIRRLASRALDVLYPPTCLACRAATDSHGALCPRCWSAMRFIERPFCERLGTPFEQDLGEGLLSPQAIADPPVYRPRARRRPVRGRAGAQARPPAQIFRPRRTRAPIARWMARAGADVLAEADVLAPVPLHPMQLWRRRFNQAAALAREVARQSGKPCDRRRARARQADAEPGRPEPRAAGGERPGGVSRRRRHGGARTQDRARRRRADLGRNRQRRLARASEGRARRTSMCSCSPGLLRRRDCPYSRKIVKLGLVRLKVPPIVIYTKSCCPYCHAAKALLRRKGAPFEEISVDGDRVGADGDGGESGRTLDRAADLHRRTAISAAATICMISRPRASSTAAGGLTDDQIRARLRRGTCVRQLVSRQRRVRDAAQRGLVACPECGSTEVEKAIMAPAVVGGERIALETAGRGADRRPSPPGARHGARICAARSRRTPTTSAQSFPKSPARSTTATSPSARSEARRA